MGAAASVLEVFLSAESLGTITCPECGGTSLYEACQPGRLTHWHEDELGWWQFEVDRSVLDPLLASTQTWMTRHRNIGGSDV